MKNILIISFDCIREGEAQLSLSIASLLAYIKSDRRYGNEFIVYHMPFNMLTLKNNVADKYFERRLSKFQLENFDTVAVSCYVWNQYLINNFLLKIRQLGFSGKLVLGGYQISYSGKENLQFEYPEGDIFLFGYAEVSLLKSILIDKRKERLYFDDPVMFSAIPSVYTTNEIPIIQGQEMLRFETKRGCPYNCMFCAHRDLLKKRVYKRQKEKIFEELALFKSKNVKRINILDPVFNFGSSYLSYMQEINRIGLNSTICLQTRFEAIKGEKGRKFLDIAEKINTHLEFGVQTFATNECIAINRKNDKKAIGNLLFELKNRNISYEVSLIYGLPNQTLDSFQYNIDFLQSKGCEKITAYPLMLLKGTELYEKKNIYNFIEMLVGDFNIPTIISSSSFTESDWLKMKEIAENLKKGASVVSNKEYNRI